MLSASLQQSGGHAPVVRRNHFVMRRLRVFLNFAMQVESVLELFKILQKVIIWIFALYTLLEPRLQLVLQSSDVTCKQRIREGANCNMVDRRSSYAMLPKRCCCSIYCCKGCSTTRSAPYE